MIGLLLVAAGAWLMIPAGSGGRVRSARRASLPLLDIAAVVAGAGVALLIPGPFGILCGLVVGVLARLGLRRIRPDDGPRREELDRQAPDAVDCLASCLAAGVPLWPALHVVADAFGGPIGTVLRRAGERHTLGSAPDQTFAELLAEPSTAPVARILVRSAESGGALAGSLVACAQRLREERAARLELRARAIGVKAVGPLGLCFLPAFLLVAVVPVVASMALGLR